MLVSTEEGVVTYVEALFRYFCEGGVYGHLAFLVRNVPPCVMHYVKFRADSDAAGGQHKVSDLRFLELTYVGIVL